MSTEIVTDFLSALEDLDIDRALALADPGIVYQNVPLPPARGIKAFERQLRLLERYCTGFEARVHNIAANGPVVLTERTDVIVVGAWRTEFWVCGRYEVRDGKITVWKDYFDWTTFIASGVKGLVLAGLKSLQSRPHQSSHVKS
ncbi:limonene-1,2-epoxide hydrolase family protein [Actinomadura rugatobispora]|uniref:Limonene-1,2-epoxide hydrolase family protein n=1 Tax=Actinomadura rugatobispora TaxID=1994 RepID=A0ABW1A1Z0_9ACTN|nr:limonene-1,2-epoxide hydrolase family protein [Actinomadura rugatobispora]